MPERRDPSQIQGYNLFGETAELPDVIHCERIETRSKLHNWELKPHRHARLHQVLVLQSGGGQANMDGRVHALGADRFVNVPQGIVHGFGFVPGTQGWVLTITVELLDELLPSGEGVRAVLNTPIVQPAIAEMKGTMQNVQQEFAGRAFARAQMLRSLTGLLLGQVARQAQTDVPTGAPHRPGGLVSRFEALIDVEFRNQIRVAEYARILAVSPTHLNRVCKKETGRVASMLVRDRVLREARRQLIFTNLSVSQIAYELGYSDPAHFSRVFSVGVGSSPRAFRQNTDQNRA
ncbi:helix-turn-helix domain-containing protein [Tropicibacter sp. Alg240-R139]|uniref:helix-turn-helix domain-containing protein n=1 Tax=Tropicibacter sp. Alg240-R139 TaxID=2305991 RepID=UPI001F0746DE|nr:helix-turn-helix domain-containing protein [Tropicibacter sp. Alg240-R139]